MPIGSLAGAQVGVGAAGCICAERRKWMPEVESRAVCSIARVTSPAAVIDPPLTTVRVAVLGRGPMLIRCGTSSPFSAPIRPSLGHRRGHRAQWSSAAHAQKDLGTRWAQNGHKIGTEAKTPT